MQAELSVAARLCGSLKCGTLASASRGAITIQIKLKVISLENAHNKGNVRASVFAFLRGRPVAMRASHLCMRRLCFIMEKAN